MKDGIQDPDPNWTTVGGVATGFPGGGTNHARAAGRGGGLVRVEITEFRLKKLKFLSSVVEMKITRRYVSYIFTAYVLIWSTKLKIYRVSQKKGLQIFKCL